METSDLLTTAEFAKKIGMNPSSVRRLLLDGIIKATVSRGRVRLIHVDQIPIALARPKPGNPTFTKKKTPKKTPKK